MSKIAARAGDRDECRSFLKGYEEFYRLRVSDRLAFADVERERREFDATLLDGLQDDVVET